MQKTDKAPLCWFCETRHWYSEDCPEGARAAVEAKKQNTEAQPDEVEGATVDRSSRVATPPSVPCGDACLNLADAEKWRKVKARQREYMRARRAKIGANDGEGTD